MLSGIKEVAARFSPGAEKAILARGKDEDGTSVPYRPTPDDLVDSAHPGKEKDFVKDHGVTRNSEGGDDDGATMAQHHLNARDHDEEPDDVGGVCDGPECDKDHVREAWEALGRHLQKRAGGTRATFRFER
jgi:hypothetical protein